MSVVSPARIGIAILLLGATGCGAPENKPEVPVAPPENEQVALPERPLEENWVEFFTNAQESTRFYVDAHSISIMPWSEVRYTVRVITATKAESVSFEGIRCRDREWRPLAFLRLDGSWSPTHAVNSFAIHETNLNDYHYALYSDYLCEFQRSRKLEQIGREFKKGRQQR